MELALPPLDPGWDVLVLLAEIMVILASTYLFSKALAKVLDSSYVRLTRNLRLDRTQFLVLKRLALFTVYLFGVVLVGSLIPGFANVWMSVLASAGVIAVVVGFAAQQAFSNIISGVFIAMFEPFKVGDNITILGEYGTVEDITLRHTVVKTWQQKRIVIPNSKISEEFIVNYSHRDPKTLETLEVGISYDSSIDEARKIMVEEARKHADTLKKVKGEDGNWMSEDEVVKVRLTALGDFSQTMRLYFWCKDKTTAIKTKHDLTEAVKKRFDKEGIEIPFPYRTIVYKKDLDSKK